MTLQLHILLPFSASDLPHNNKRGKTQMVGKGRVIQN